jgi:hypothetical protein
MENGRRVRLPAPGEQTGADVQSRSALTGRRLGTLAELSMRDRRLQRAIDTLNLHGGLMGAAEVADALGIKVPNLKWVGIEPVASISRGRIPVFLAADVQAEIIRREGRAAKAE